MLRNKIIEEIFEERKRQDRLHAHFFVTRHTAMTVLAEEVGEVAKAINDRDTEGLRQELIQVAAVCVKWLEQL